MDIDLIDVMIIIIASVILGGLIAFGIGLAVESVRIRRARKLLQPMLGVVLPREDKE